MEREAAPNLRGIKGLWGVGRKGFRMVRGERVPTGAVARPGSMSVLIEQMFADPALVEKHLAMKPVEPVYTGPVGGVPEFVSVQSKKRLTVVGAEECGYG